MEMRGPRVTFIFGGSRYTAPSEGSLLEVGRALGLPFTSLCGGRGKCGKCRVRATGLISEPDPLEQELLTPEELARGVRLACRARAMGNVEVELDEEVLQDIGYREVPIPLDPVIQKAFLEITPPSLEDQRPDLERLEGAIGSPLHVPFELLHSLPSILREGEFKVTATLYLESPIPELLSLESKNSPGDLYGLALDIGTTTVAGYLVDLLTGKEVSRSSRLNAQASWGADVLSRVSFAGTPKGKRDLQSAIRKTILDIIIDCSEGIDPRYIYYVVVVGNSIMHHLFLGLDPVAIGRAPYTPVASRPFTIPAKELGLPLPYARVYSLPLIGGYVGADTVGVILATGLDQSQEIKLAVDIGTNGEIVLGSKGRLLACSAAAGPAFEGAHIKYGMRASPGAIDRVRLSSDVKVWTIGDIPPKGVCGSGLIDAVAEMLRTGIIDPTGRLRSREELHGRLPVSILDRIRDLDYEREFVLSKEPFISITQKDIRELQLAKGAILAGIRVLMAELGIEEGEISQVFLAGAFGNFIDKRSAETVGLIPRVPLEKIQGIGNGAGQGAKMVLLSRSARLRAEEIARKVNYIELSLHPLFQEEFMKGMAFEA